ncbi:MAG: HD family phosphohydrolase [Gemmataceae bacterium]
MLRKFTTPRRLRQWVCKCSSAHDEPVLPCLWRRSVWCRLAPVWGAVLSVTALLLMWGPSLPYRVGEIPARDLRTRVPFEEINHALTERYREEAIERLTDPRERETVYLTVPSVVEHYPPGIPLARRGQPITERQLSLLAKEHQAYCQTLTPQDRWRRSGALFLVNSLLAALIVLYVVRFQTSLAESLPKITAVCVLIFLTMLLILALSRSPWHAHFIPLMVTAMILTIAYNPQFALLMSISLTLMTTMALGTDMHQLLIMMGGMASAVLLLRNVRTRSRLVQVAVGAGLASMAMTVAAGLLSGQTGHLIALDAGRHFVWALLAGFIVSGSLPLIERAFGIVTDISLLELADGRHPLMQELIRRAPGTYTHSITVGTLAEAAAEAIDANPLLARVGSYFHDIGKMLKPHYFIENQTGINRHDDLEPALSTLVIIGHVKDGIALAKQYRLPKPIVDCIQEHHGTTLVEYFYREAVKQQQQLGNTSCDLEPTFRYPGPKPQSPETAIIMMADCVESSSRALSVPNPNSLRKLVHDMLMKRLLDGQFEESGLTLTQLHQIEDSLCKGLIALYHARIKYPAEESTTRKAG